MNLAEFIRTQIETVPELRVLLLIHGQPQAEWSALEITQQLYLQAPMVSIVLTGLVNKGFLASVGDPPSYRYQPRSAELAGLIGQLAEMDRVQPVTLVNLIAPLPGISRKGPLLSSSQ